MKDNKLIDFILNNHIIYLVLILIISYIIYLVFKKIINNTINKISDNEKQNKKHITYLKLILDIIKYVIIVLDVVIILNNFGVNISSILAGLGIASVITGLALQDALKDIIAGFNIYLDGYYNVGDVIKIDETEAKIIEIKLKVTILKDITNNNIFVIANRNIIKSVRLSNELDIIIPLPYELDTLKAEKIIEEIIKQIKSFNKVSDVIYKGLDEFAASSVNYKLKIFVSPIDKIQIKREALRISKIILDKHKVSIPYMQIDLHQKK